MPKATEELSPTVICPRADCKAEIPVIDCYHVVQAEVPQIGVTCPGCGKPTTLSKAKTIAYCNEYSQIQQDIDNALGYKSAEITSDEDFGDLVLRGLDAFGYGGPKNTQKKKIIRSMVDTVATYQSQQGLQQLLLAQKIKPNDAMMIAQFVFAGDFREDGTIEILRDKLGECGCVSLLTESSRHGLPMERIRSILASMNGVTCSEEKCCVTDMMAFSANMRKLAGGE